MWKLLLVLTLPLSFRIAHAAASNVTSGSTAKLQSLNKMIARGSGFYNGGKGVVVRDMLDLGLQSSPYTVVPSTFWVNDIVAVTQMFIDLEGTLQRLIADPFDMVSVGICIGSKMSALYPQFDKIQDADWDQGVFYAHDANAVDVRCRWLPEEDGYDCPTGFIPRGGRFSPDANHKGAGSYGMGNPELNKTNGGGTGCHFSNLPKGLNNLNETSAGMPNLMDDMNCKCNQAFKHDWSKWVDAFLTIEMPTTHWVSPNLWWGQWGDQSMCWHNNVRDMIAHQNAMFAKRNFWSEGVFLGVSGWPERQYEGWNEVPTDRLIVGDPKNWDLVVLKLPANVCHNGGADDSLHCLNGIAKLRLDEKLHQNQDAGLLIPGKEHINSQPGSYVAVVREAKDANGDWYREFFCESYTTRGIYGYEIVYDPPSATNTDGACYATRRRADEAIMIV